MKAFDGYKQFIEWDRIATKGEYQPAWIENLGLAVGWYLRECVTYGKTPTFDGFFEYLKPEAPKEGEKV